MKTTQQQIEEKRRELAELEKQLGREGLPWKPEVGDEYWFVSTDAEAYDNKWGDHPLHKDLYEIGNCYKTEQEAETAVKKQKAYMRIVRKIHELNDGWTPDWLDGSEGKYYMVYEHEDCDVSFWREWCCQQMQEEFYFKYSVRHEVIEHCADDFKIWLGVE